MLRRHNLEGEKQGIFFHFVAGFPSGDPLTVVLSFDECVKVRRRENEILRKPIEFVAVKRKYGEMGQWHPGKSG
jgi:hypothetical protein